MTGNIAAGGALWRFGPVLIGASAFAVGDIVGKVALLAGADVLTLTTVRSYIGLVLLFVWLVASGAPGVRRRRGLSSEAAARAASEPTLPASARRFAWLLGILFTGNVFFLFKAIEATEVPVAVLTYFAYPLLTGLAAAATRLEPLSWRGAAAAIVAFGGLALMIGAHPSGIAIVGVAAGLAAASCRVVMLLIVRARLSAADSRLVTLHSLLSSTALFSFLMIVTGSWQPPASAGGWLAVVVLGAGTAVGILCVFVSTARIGPFRTALFMNLEPLLTAIMSAAFLGEFLSPMQMLGGAIMLAALVAFQIRR